MNLKSPHLSLYFAPIAGLLGSGLYTTLFTAGLDGRGLPDPAHWSHWGLWLLTGLVLLAVFVTHRRIPSGEVACVRSKFSGIGCLIGAAACLAFAPPAVRIGSLATVDTVLRGMTGTMLCVLAFCRFTGRKAPFLLHSVVCVYLAFRMINQYRIWSADPQIIEYCFYLCGYVALMLTAYQLAALDAGIGSLKKLWLWAPIAVFGCFVTLAGPQELLFMPAFGIWALSSLSAWKPVTVEPEDV